MKTTCQFKIHKNERFYRTIMYIVSAFAYVGLILFLLNASKPTLTAMGVFGLYGLAFLLFTLCMHIYLIGYIKGSGVQVNEKQFPEAYAILKAQSEKLGLAQVPAMYLLQSGGMLNAFATRFSGRNYVILYSDVLGAAYDEGMTAVAFIIGHELGHLKRNHVSLAKSIFTLPSKLIPFLGAAYSRACETTCDNIGYALCPEGAEKGMLILAAGRELYKKVQVNELLAATRAEKGFAMWFAEVFSSHPPIVDRITHLQELASEEVVFKSSTVVQEQAQHDESSQQPPASL